MDFAIVINFVNQLNRNNLFNHEWIYSISGTQGYCYFRKIYQSNPVKYENDDYNKSFTSSIGYWDLSKKNI